LASVLYHIIQQKIGGRVEQLGPVIVRGTVKLEGGVAGSQVQYVYVGCQPALGIPAAYVGHHVVGHGLDGHRGVAHSGQNGDLPDKVNGFIALNHIDISIFKFIDDPVFTFCNNSEIP